MGALEEWLLEMLLANGVKMLRAEAEIKAKVIALLVLMQKDLVAVLANAGELTEMNKAAKAVVLSESNALIAKYYADAQLQVDLVGVAEVEALGVRKALSSVIERAAPGAISAEVRLGLGMPTEAYLKKLASDTLIQGSPAKNWWLRQTQDTQFKVANQIRIGAAQGETNAQIIKRIVGEEATVKPAVAAPTAKAPTPELVPGQPGVMPLAKKNAAAVVQTSMATVSAAARRATLELNKDVTNGFMQVSTLDSHTSLTCIAYSGASWNWEYQPINGNDLPWNGGVPRHWNCRSVEIALMKTLRQIGIDMDDPEPGDRASAAGPISAKTTFAEFLTKMGADYQDEVLGKGRAELFRAGKLTPRELVDMSGRPLKLDDLRAQYDPARAFKQPKGEFTIYDPGYKRVAADVSTPARATAVKFEETIRRNDYETGAFFGKDGKMLLARAGQPDRVAYTVGELKSMNGALFTHNHPGGSTFSVADLRNGSFAGLSEVRAVSSGYRHIIEPVDTWPAEGAIKRAFDREEAAARRDVDTMVRAGDLSAKYATTEIYHLQWLRAAPKLGLKYTREAS
jgi:hypothetical protein